MARLKFVLQILTNVNFSGWEHLLIVYPEMKAQFLGLHRVSKNVWQSPNLVSDSVLANQLTRYKLCIIYSK